MHYAPLAWVQGEQAAPDLRLAFRPLSAGIPAADEAALAAEAEARAEETDGAPTATEAAGPAVSRSQTTAAAEAAADEGGAS